MIRHLLPLCLLAGCAATPHTAGPQACRIEKAAEAPLGIEHGFVAIPATIDTTPVTMQVDTGSETTLVTPTAMANLRLQPDLHARTTIQGTGGNITTQNARLQSFGIGAMSMLDQSYAVGPLPSGALRSTDASGLLGADWLSGFDVDLDVPHRRIALYRVHGCSGDYLPWQGPRASVFATKYGRGVMLMSVALDGAPATAMLDSGANRSVLSDAAAARAGVSAATLAHDSAGTSTGIDGNVREIHQHRFATFDVGAEHDRDVSILVGRLRSPTGAEMLLGLDWLQGHRVWIAYQERRVFIQAKNISE